METSNATSPSPGSAFQNLFPSICQSFIVILCGYVAARTNLVTQVQAKGLGNYITYFALPALLFLKLTTLDFSEVDWVFWSTIFLAKLIVFVIVFFITFITQKKADLGSSALFGIFATQSNDFALGYPIISAIYGDEYPFLVEYIFFFGPISLLFINPIGFLLMELQKSWTTNSQRSCLSLIWSVTKGLMTNPILNVVLLAVIANFTFQQNLPSLVSDILEVLGQSFAATALFYLGINMVGSIQKISGIQLAVPGLLICAKLILLPLIINASSYILHPGKDTNMTSTYSTYGFLYGTIPTAPSVFVYSTQYEVAQDVIATALVFCTLFAGPVMFITATMAMLPSMSPGVHNQMLEETAFYVSCSGLASCIWVLLIFIFGRRVRKLPHHLTTNLVIAQIISGIGVILCYAIDSTNRATHIIQFTFLLMGVFGSRTWTSVLAIGLCLLRTHSEGIIRRNIFWFYLLGWGYPLLVVSVLLVVGSEDEFHISIVFDWNRQQLIAAVCILIVNLVITIIALIVMHKYDRFSRGRYTAVPGIDSVDSKSSTSSSSSSEVDTEETNDNDVEPRSRHLQSDVQAYPSDVHGLAWTSTYSQKTLSTTVQSANNKRKSGSKSKRKNATCFCDCMESRVECHQLGRHMTLLLCLTLSMLIGLSLCLWKLMHDPTSGVYLEMEFLDKVLNYGQGCIMLAVFGFDIENVIKPLLKLFRRVLNGKERKNQSSLTGEVLLTCQQFKEHHFANCKQAIEGPAGSFCGSILVDWLIEVGLAENREDGTVYGKKLAEGGVLYHVYKHQQTFFDNMCQYGFAGLEEV